MMMMIVAVRGSSSTVLGDFVVVVIDRVVDLSIRRSFQQHQVSSTKNPFRVWCASHDA